MKYLFIVAVILFASCTKSKNEDPKHCYVCTQFDSTYSNVPALSDSHKRWLLDKTYCDYTQTMVNDLIKSKTFQLSSSAHDTTYLYNYSMTCTQQ